MTFHTDLIGLDCVCVGQLSAREERALREGIHGDLSKGV